MGKEWSLDRIIREGREGVWGAYTPDVSAWLDELEQQQEAELGEDEEQLKIDKDEQLRWQQRHNAFIPLYGLLPREQFFVRYYRVVWKMTYAKIAALTGKSRGALRTNNCRALKNINRIIQEIDQKPPRKPKKS